jgi:hypothetical protein
MKATPHAKLAEALAKIPDSRIADVLLEGMSATTISRSGAVEPDTRTRIQAANLIIQYKVGRPGVSDGPPAASNDEGEGKADLVQQMAQSPAFFRSVEVMLEKAAKLRDSKDAEEKA